jgi:hypothetical protein
VWCDREQHKSKSVAFIWQLNSFVALHLQWNCSQERVDATLVNDMSADQRVTTGRRQFLRAVGLGGGSALLASASLTGAASAEREESDQKRTSRYRETDHVRTFYQVNRYPTSNRHPTSK